MQRFVSFVPNIANTEVMLVLNIKSVLQKYFQPIVTENQSGNNSVRILNLIPHKVSFSGVKNYLWYESTRSLANG